MDCKPAAPRGWRGQAVFGVRALIHEQGLLFQWFAGCWCLLLFYASTRRALQPVVHLCPIHRCYVSPYKKETSGSPALSKTSEASTRQKS
jgi:hypothetical protein